MKTIELRKHESEKVLHQDGEPGLLDTKYLIRAVLETPPPGGFTGTSEMADHINIINKVRKLPADATSIELEDAEVRTLLKAAGRMKWMKLDEFIVEFEKSLK